jgi:superfamily I DNA and/or RNA helicase
MASPDGAFGVLVCTFGMLRSASGGACGGFDAQRHVSALLVDEASQAWAGLAYLFDACLPNLTRLHLFGDHNQLPPALAPRAAVKPTGVRSMYDAAAAAGHARHALRSQYRMPRPLASFISHAMYGAQLRTHARPDDASVCALSAAPMRWCDVPHGRAEHPPAGSTGTSTSWLNAAEVGAVLAEMARIDGMAADDESRVVLTPYVAQRAALEAAAGPRARVGGGRWDIKTIDAYQGREARHVILSLVRAGAGFLSDARRANVALSRAAGTLTVVGKHAAWARCPDAALMRAFAQRLKPSLCQNVEGGGGAADELAR